MPVDSQIPESTPYAIIGGDAAVRNLVHRVNDLMDEHPDSYGIRKPHTVGLSGARE